MNELLEILSILIVLGCITAWMIIWIRMWGCMITGKCPKDRICENSACKNRAWCRKYQRCADIYKYAGEILRNKRRHAKKK